MDPEGLTLHFHLLQLQADLLMSELLSQLQGAGGGTSTALWTLWFGMGPLCSLPSSLRSQPWPEGAGEEELPKAWVDAEHLIIFPFLLFS